MGQYRETAKATGDIALLKRDILADALACFDDWADLSDGPDDVDITNMANDYRTEGLDPAEAAEDLRAGMAAHYAEMRERHSAATTLGRLGGSARSERKAAASRANGKRGGRPKTQR